MKAMCLNVWRLRGLLTALLIAFAFGAVIASPGAKAAQLSDSTIAYLASHAEDAIHWLPWDEPALALAESEEKLIFLTLGYAAYHWCHVLAQTTLKDAAVIAALDADYVSLLVDREERPDLDSHFCEVMLAMTGRSGYPAIFTLTPDGVPIFATGYLSAKPEHGNPGLLEILRGIADAWRDNRAAILDDAEINREWLRDNAALDFSTISGHDDGRSGRIF